MARDFSRKFYKSKLWQQQREYILKRDKYLCVKCGAVAEEVHHIIKLTPENITDNKIAIYENNLISLCRDCHFKEHREDRGISNVVEGYEFDENGFIVQSPHKK